MLRCKEVTRRIATEEFAEGSWRDRLAVRLHLAMCQHCRRYFRQMREIGRAVRRLVASPPVDSETLQRLEVAILEDESRDSP